VSTPLRFGTQGTVPDVAGRWSVVLGRGVVGVEEGQSACVHFASLRDTGDSPGRCWSVVGWRFDSSRDSPPVSTPLRFGTQGTVPDVEFAEGRY